MLRIRTQKEIKDVLVSLIQIHHEGFSGSEEQILQDLSDCQQAAVAVGEQLERELTDSEEPVHLLENYCEQAYQMAQDLQNVRGRVAELDQIIQTVADMVSSMPAKYQVIFMPYKAAMWDALESIWIAASKDPECDCRVVPLPYFELDPEQNKMKEKYEGAQFPSYVPVVDYHEYSLQDNLPDVIYIHNPYDDCNRVTSIHPSYYSRELKKYTEELVYVPYFVTSGYYGMDQRILPAYYQMDHMIVQSEHYKHEADGIFYFDKMLPLGSPKLDRVIRICAEKRELPDEWKKTLQGKKIVMLNTSINQMLFDTRAYLNKLKYVFDCFRERKDVALIWRPHPLLRASVQSMRPEFSQELEALIHAFQEEKIGILDQTPDLTATIAVSDAYMGEIASSVINLFGAAGKPLFILNNYISGVFSGWEKRRVGIESMSRIEDKILLSNGAGLFCMSDRWDNIEFLGRVENQTHWNSAYTRSLAVDEKVYLVPFMATEPAVYDLKQKRFCILPGVTGETDLKLRQVIRYQNRLFYLPSASDGIYEYNLQDGSWQIHTDCMKEWKSGVDTPIYEDTFACRAQENILYITATYSNQVLKFDMDSGKYEFLAIGEKTAAYSGIEITEDELWLAEVHSGSIVRCNLREKAYSVIKMPPEFHFWKSVFGRCLAHTEIFRMGDDMITIPGFSDTMVRINRKTGEAKVFLPQLWQIPQGKINGYDPGVCMTAGLCQKWDENVLYVQRNRDAALFRISVNDETYEEIHPLVSEESLQKMLLEDDGFEKIDTTAEFSRKESPFFSLNEFLDDLVQNRLTGVKERQEQALETMAANLDGTCGEKVHIYIKKGLDRKYRK